MKASVPALPRMLLEDRLHLLRRLVVFAWLLLIWQLAAQVWLRAAAGFDWPERAGFSMTFNALLGVFAVNTVVLTALLLRRDWFERIPRNAEHRVGWLQLAVLAWLGLHLFYAFHVSGGLHGPLLALPPVLLIAGLSLLPGRAGWRLAAYLLAGFAAVIAMQQLMWIHPTGELRAGFALYGPGAPLGALTLLGVLLLAVAVAQHARRWIYPGAVAGSDLLRLDPDTGLFTGRFLRARIVRELGRATRQQSWSALVLLDTGDDAEASLQHAARVLRGTVRLHSDTPAHLHGGRMAVLLPDTGVEGATAFCQRIRRAFADAGLRAPRMAGAATQDRACDAATLEAEAVAALVEQPADAPPRVVSI